MRRPAGVMILIALAACTSGERPPSTATSGPLTPAVGSPTSQPASPRLTGPVSGSLTAVSSPDPSPVPVLDRNGRWRADVAQAVEAIVKDHPEPFGEVREGEFRAAVAALADEVAALSDAEIVAGLMRLAAMLGARNGHNGVFPLAQPGEVLHALPLRLYQFTDGMYVVDAREPYDELIGSRLLSIGGQPVEDVARRMGPLVAADNEHSRRSRLPLHLVVPELVTTVGQAKDMSLSVRRGNRVEQVTPDPIPMPEYAEWIGFVSPLVPPSVPQRRTRTVPLWLSDQDEHFWMRWLPESRTVYLQYNQVQAITGSAKSMSELADAMLAEVAGRRALRVVVDVRHNPGGENSASLPLITALGKLDVPVVLLTGPATFSAAGVFVARAQTEARAIVVGEPTGGAPTLYGDGEPLTLEHSGVVLHVATQAHETIEGDDRVEITPDDVVPLAAADYFAGRDPVLQTAVRRTTPLRP